MSTRLQVVLDETELDEIRQVAKRHRMTVAEWVRQALRAARRAEPQGEPHRKLAAVHEGARHEYPSADIGQMLDDVTRGHG